ncbi:MAG TPA: radical SAM protein [Candidatus Omnitrophota bacterium]|nr:radical SAM protein [Candidatus Omnitrophota bacterium]
MKVLFLTPPLKAWDSHGHHLAPNQMHAQLAAYVREKKLGEPFVIDSRASDLDWDGMMKRVREIQPDLVFVGELLHSTCGAAVIGYFNDGLKMIKEAMPNVRTIAGGLWYSGDWERQMRLNPTIDYIMIGEAELTLEDLVNNLKAKKKDEREIPGLVSRRSDGTIVVGPHRDLIPDLNVLPMPAYDLFPMDKYVGHTYWKPFTELMTSRGCPGKCHFCYEWALYDSRTAAKDFTSWRGLSGKRIVDELDILEKKYGITTVVFQDDAFNTDTQAMIEFCEEKIRRGNKIDWVALGRADQWVSQHGILPLMKKAGLFLALTGVEVEDDMTLAKQGKGVTVGQIKKTIQILRENDIGSVGTVLIGLREDTEAKIKQRLQVADEIDPDIFALDYMTPVPNSPDWKYGIKQGWFDPDKIDLKTWDFQHPVVPTDHLSVEEVGRLGAWCMREYYSKPERIHRIFTSNYDQKVKLCVKDFMDNIAKWEKNSRTPATVK